MDDDGLFGRREGQGLAFVRLQRELLFAGIHGSDIAGNLASGGSLGLRAEIKAIEPNRAAKRMTLDNFIA